MTTTDYLAWLDAELDDAATDLAEHRSLNSPGFADAVAREFIASQTPNTPSN